MRSWKEGDSVELKEVVQAEPIRPAVNLWTEVSPAKRRGKGA